MSGELWSVLLFHFRITGLRSFPIQPQNFSHIDHSCLHAQLQTSFIFLADQNFKIKNQLVLIIFKTYRDLWNSKFSFVNKSDTNIINLLFTNISKHRVGLIQSGSFRILFYWNTLDAKGRKFSSWLIVARSWFLLGNKSQSRISIQDVFLSRLQAGLKLTTHMFTNCMNHWLHRICAVKSGSQIMHDWVQQNMTEIIQDDNKNYSQ